VEQVQEVLGEHQDAVVAGQWLRTHAADGGGRVECALVAGELRAREDVASRRARQWPATGTMSQAALVASMDVSRTSTSPRCRWHVHRHRSNPGPRCCSCTGPATTIGACRRARRSRERTRETALRGRGRGRGLRCELGAPPVQTRYRDSKGRDGVVHYWLMAPPGER
jgi:hypothetical protein